MLHGKIIIIKKTENPDANILNKLISRIPRELLANEHLVFETSKSADSGRLFVEIKLKSDNGLADLACIALNSKGGEHAHFMPSTGTCDADDDSTTYCIKMNYTEDFTAANKQICPYSIVCDQVEAFLKNYAKKYNIKLE